MQRTRERLGSITLLDKVSVTPVIRGKVKPLQSRCLPWQSSNSTAYYYAIRKVHYNHNPSHHTRRVARTSVAHPSLSIPAAIAQVHLQATHHVCTSNLSQDVLHVHPHHTHYQPAHSRPHRSCARMPSPAHTLVFSTHVCARQCWSKRSRDDHKAELEAR